MFRHFSKEDFYFQQLENVSKYNKVIEKMINRKHSLSQKYSISHMIFDAFISKRNGAHDLETTFQD